MDYQVKKMTDSLSDSKYSCDDQTSANEMKQQKLLLQIQKKNSQDCMLVSGDYAEVISQ